MWQSNPYALTIDELASRQIGLRSVSGGVAFARKGKTTEKLKKHGKILRLFTRDAWPKGLSILTMPGLKWEFERALLSLREGNWAQRTNPARSTHICGLEIDPAIYRASLAFIPGLKHNHSATKIIDGPMWAAHSLETSAVRRYHNCDFYTMAANYEHAFDAAWLDFTGPLNEARMEIIKRFYNRNVRSVLIVTALAARTDMQTNVSMFNAGSLEDWYAKELPGKIEHCSRYMDTSPMIQYAVRKSANG